MRCLFPITDRPHCPQNLLHVLFRYLEQITQSKHWKRNDQKVSSFNLLSYLLDKGCSYLKMMSIYGFVHLAPTSFIFGSSSSVCLATSARLTVTALSLSCFKVRVKKFWTPVLSESTGGFT